MCTREEKKRILTFATTVTGRNEASVRRLLIQAKMRLPKKVPLEEVCANLVLYGFQHPATLASSTRISLSEVGFLPS